MANKDVEDMEGWMWDDDAAVETNGNQAQHEADMDLIRVTGANTVDKAVDMLLGRPRVSERREPTVQVQFKAPVSMRDYLAEMTRKVGLKNKSQYLRLLVERDMASHGKGLQTA
ncbi:MAG: hypothetical protein J6575_07525 [Bifidobacterium sp.]|nr:hypothetical protein [Bifidobacterium sp.]